VVIASLFQIAMKRKDNEGECKLSETKKKAIIMTW